MDEWKPIETAPKDGSGVLAIIVGFEPTVAWWSEPIGWVFFDEMQGEYYPTHWMELPELPKEDM